MRFQPGVTAQAPSKYGNADTRDHAHRDQFGTLTLHNIRLHVYPVLKHVDGKSKRIHYFLVVMCPLLRCNAIRNATDHSVRTMQPGAPHLLILVTRAQS